MTYFYFRWATEHGREISLGGVLLGLAALIYAGLVLASFSGSDPRPRSAREVDDWLSRRWEGRR